MRLVGSEEGDGVAELLLVDGENLGLQPRTVHRLGAALVAMAVDVDTDRVVLFFGTARRVGEYATGLEWDVRQLVQGNAGKNAADIALTIEAVDSWHRGGDRPDGVIIGGGDFDYRPLVDWLDGRGIGTRLVVLADTDINPYLEGAVRSVTRLPDDTPHAVEAAGARETRAIVLGKLLARLVPGPEERLRILGAIDEQVRAGAARITPDDFEGYPSAAHSLLDGSMRGRLGPLLVIDDAGIAGRGARYGPWVEEAELAWLAWAGARVLGESWDKTHSAAVQKALTQTAGGREHLAANAWALAAFQARPPGFVAAALQAGFAAPPSYRARRRLAKLGQTHSQLRPAEAAGLDEARRTAGPEATPDETDIAWVAQVLQRAPRPPKAYPVTFAFYFDAPFQVRKAAEHAFKSRGLID